MCPVWRQWRQLVEPYKEKKKANIGRPEAGLFDCQKILDREKYLVIMNNQDYWMMCLKILQDSDCYIILEKHPTVSFYWELKIILEHALKFKPVYKREFSFLSPNNPKIHKGFNPLKCT